MTRKCLGCGEIYEVIVDSESNWCEKCRDVESHHQELQMDAEREDAYWDDPYFS